MKYRKYFFSFLLSIISFYCLGQQPININNLKEEVGKGLYFFVDSSNKLDAGQIKNLYTQKGFVPVNSNFYHVGYSNAMHWLAIELTNTSNELVELMFKAEDPSCDELELFESHEGVVKSFGITGDLKPFSQRPVLDKNFVYPISIPANGTSLYLLRIANHGHSNFIPIEIQTAKSFIQGSIREYLLWGFFVGAILFMILFAIFIFISLRDKFYIYYAFYVTSMLIWVLGNNGIGYQYIWGNSPFFMGIVRFVSGTLSIVLMLNIMQIFLDQNKYNSRFYKPTNFLKWALALMWLLPWIPYNYLSNEKLITSFLVIADVLSLACTIVILGSSIEKIRQRVSVAIYFFIASISLTLGGATLFLLRLKVIPANGITLNLIYVGFIIEVIILTFGLTIRYNNYKKEREKLLVKIKEQEKETAIKLALAKEGERRRIAADMHDDLGAGLSGLRLMSELATRKETTAEFKKETLRIASSASDLSDRMKDIIWTLNIENDSLQKLLFYIHQYGNELFEDAEINFNMQLPQSIPAYNITGEWRRHLFLAIKEAFNNIIKHANASSVTCIINIGTELCIEVRDNGRGFSLGKTSNGNGNGMSNMKLRMKEINGNLTMLSNEGTTLVFTVPLPQIIANP